MLTANLFLLALFLLTIGHLVTLKAASNALDHRTAPLFVSGWSLLGLALVAPVYGHLLAEGLRAYAAQPLFLALTLAKGVLLYLLLVSGQALTKESLSSRHYVTPLVVGVLAAGNFLLGERLTPGQWISALGLSALAAGFFLRGHLSGLSREGKRRYAALVVLGAGLGMVDHAVISAVNWYALLLLSNIVLFAVALALNRARAEVLKSALTHRSAILAGAFYAATELVKFYQQVTINPVTAVVTAQALTKPVILVLSALVWKERTVREQLVWGCAAFGFIILPFLPALR